MLETLRAWTEAQSNPRLRLELDLMNLIRDFLYQYRDGKVDEEKEAACWQLRPHEQAALRVVADLWQRMVDER